MNNGFSMARVEVLARREGVSFSEAARRCARKGARVKREKRAAELREARRLTAWRGSWWAQRDFE